MKIEYISNRTFSIHDELGLQLNKAAEILIATAFIDKSAINLLEEALDKNKNLKSVKLLIGLYGYFNKKEDLLRLRTLAAKHAAKAQIQISRNAHFHWKFYYFKQRQTEIYYTGSANFTVGGLVKNSELLLKISTNTKDKSGVSEIIKEFNKEWDRSANISAIKLDSYFNRDIIGNENVELKKFALLFPQEEVGQIEKSKIESNKAVVLLLTHYLKSTTIKMVSNNLPNWKEFAAIDTKGHFQNCINIKQLLIIDRKSIGSYKWHWAIVKDSTAQLSTPDGKYFIEYEIIQKPKSLKLDQIKTLKSKEFKIDIKARKNIFIQKVIGSSQVKKIKEILK